jgi:hypothetical protein
MLTQVASLLVRSVPWDKYLMSAYSAFRRVAYLISRYHDWHLGGSYVTPLAFQAELLLVASQLNENPSGIRSTDLFGLGRNSAWFPVRHSLSRVREMTFRGGRTAVRVACDDKPRTRPSEAILSNDGLSLPCASPLKSPLGVQHWLQ